MLAISRAHMLLALIQLLQALISITSLADKLNSFYSCDLTRYDIETGVTDNATYPLSTVPEIYRSKLAQPPLISSYRNVDTRWLPGPNDDNWRATRGIKLLRLKRDYVPVRIRILYDDSFEEEFSRDKDELFVYVRNLILDMQMRYEDPRMLDAIKFVFVITRLEKLRYNWPSGASVEDMAHNFDALQGSARDKDYDITFVFFYTSIFGTGGIKIYGSAPIGTFCNLDASYPIVFMDAHSINMANTLTHEFAHSLNVHHDGNKFSLMDNGTVATNFFERRCDPKSNIMSPQSDAGRTTWSQCSIDAMTYYLSEEQIYKCVTDPERISNSKPLLPMFDFRDNSSYRSPPPGEQIPLDRQCQLGYDKSIRSVDGKFGLRSGITTCGMLYCRVDREAIELFPALCGSKCWFVGANQQLQEGVCKYGICLGS